ncbi:MAG: phytanoyl-CoA dioxygenase family protein [Bacteroidota bacterium]|nr:phytanoyl-CoA dioxygenase family protein [Bacteroidota bacterium]MDP4216225.1 phytanoyl-CoA dioxygenase family protein [Bacteroidota bacterium]MDP4245116.1 phytanoyl-CoA dioxygenase family protein [Bacteroidota bacterium]MDP4253334.1 phytanoyl-CoA dioxygenase family protein [Bacteroidota bacterium]MDP4256777.1 phytanoyl-CoA dioxygenase family protein [Bacteroidota bacterium]
MSLKSALKKVKVVHWIYNLVHYRSLLHNRAAYKKYKIRKSLTASISSKDFPDKESRAWLDTGHSRELAPTREAYFRFPASLQQQILSWSDNGYMILDQFFDEATIDQILEETARLVRQHRLTSSENGKLMFANRLSPRIREFTNDKRLIELLGFILDKEVVPFQTINFIRGSNQRAHSDSIHMTTYPLGYLIAVWVALEDTTPDNGPLFYYPGSHRLPYLLNNDFNDGETVLTLGKKEYPDYEERIARLIAEKALERKVFLARKGDVLIWHANLIHGGMPVNDPASTRKSMVIHYYARDVIKYHEITERPSLLK